MCYRKNIVNEIFSNSWKFLGIVKYRIKYGFGFIGKWSKHILLADSKLEQNSVIKEIGFLYIFFEKDNLFLLLISGNVDIACKLWWSISPQTWFLAAKDAPAWSCTHFMHFL